tara:strand:+ start:241 stop:561 length:321 start_codon:yes stop_codon:yes gene_type:complete
MRLFKKIFCFAILSILIGGCQSVKDGLTGQKRTTSDEFLVQKKNPLILPPDYQNLPKPINEKTTGDTNQDVDNDIQKILGQKSEVQKKITNNETSIESSILEKIKD